MKEKEITVVVVEPGKKPYVDSVAASLSGMQKRVGGNIQALYPFEEQVAIVCNEEGKLQGVPLNRALRNAENDVYDVIAGTFFVADCSGEDFGSLSKEQQEKYQRMFFFPERFAIVNGHVTVTQYEAF